MQTNRIYTNLEYREIIKGQDIDYFIETLSYPISMELPISYMSRIQFPKSRAVLVRTSLHKTRVTIHIMRDVDLHSSFANFEIDLEGCRLNITKEEGYIAINVK